MSARSFTINGNRNRFGNVTVYRDSTSIAVELHNTVVARLNLVNSVVNLNTGGWDTSTTKTAINNALAQFNSAYYVFQHKKQWYIGNKNNNAIIKFVDNITLSHLELIKEGA